MATPNGRWRCVNSPASLTVVNDTAYVAHERGLALVDLVSGGVTEVCVRRKICRLRGCAVCAGIEER